MATWRTLIPIAEAARGGKENFRQFVAPSCSTTAVAGPGTICLMISLFVTAPAGLYILE